MRIEHGSDRAQLADLYRKSGTVQFGEKQLAAHQANPDLPPTPIYFHFPKEGEPNFEMVEEIEELAAKIFFSMIEEHGVNFRRIAAVPKGAQGIAAKLAKLLEYWYNDLLLVFDKEERNGQNFFFGPIKGEADPWDRVLGIEDHTSGGYNKGLFLDCMSMAQLGLVALFNIVDRQQGGVAFLKSFDVAVYSIFTIEELLVYYLETNQITLEQAEVVRAYIANNQLWVPPDH